MDKSLVILSLGFAIVLAILTIISLLLFRSPVSISSDLLGAIVGYLFGNLNIIIAYYFQKDQNKSE